MMLPTIGTAAARPRKGGTFPQLLAMEWIKLRSLRSTGWTLLGAALLATGLTGMFGGLARSSAELRTSLTVVETAAFGVETAQLFMIVLGALIITGEYSSGSIRTTLAAVSGRGRLMAAKAAVLAATAWALGALVGAACVLVAGALLPGGFDASATEVVWTAAGGGAYLALIALLTFGAGTALRSTAATISVPAGLLAVVPSLLPLLPATVVDRVTPLLPALAAEVLLTGQAEGEPYGPWAALAVLCGWTLVALVAGYGTLRKRDA
jgi:ABC-2 type transport system permease protein